MEPKDSSDVCHSCADESQLITAVEIIQDETEPDTLSQAYPNPFNAETKIKIYLPEAFSTNELTFTIYNIMGQEIRSFQPQSTMARRNYEFLLNNHQLEIDQLNLLQNNQV